MSTVIISADSNQATEVQCGDKLFHLYRGEDGTLYIEAPGRRYLEITISDDDEAQVTARGLWANVDVAPEED